MLTILAVVLFAVVFFKVFVLALKITWGLAKVLAFVLILAALPSLLWCVLCASGVILFSPILLLAAAFGVLKLI